MEEAGELSWADLAGARLSDRDGVIGLARAAAGFLDLLDDVHTLNDLT